MDVELHSVWNRAKTDFLKSLPADDAVKIISICSDQSLVHEVSDLCRRYTEHGLARRLEPLQPFTSSIRSFTRVISTFTQHDPQISLLVWGSISFVLEVSSLNFDTLEWFKVNVVQLTDVQGS